MTHNVTKATITLHFTRSHHTLFYKGRRSHHTPFYKGSHHAPFCKGSHHAPFYKGSHHIPIYKRSHHTPFYKESHHTPFYKGSHHTLFYKGSHHTQVNKGNDYIKTDKVIILKLRWKWGVTTLQQTKGINRTPTDMNTQQRKQDIGRILPGRLSLNSTNACEKVPSPFLIHTPSALPHILPAVSLSPPPHLILL